MSKVKSLKLIILAMIVLSVLFPFVVQSSMENNKIDNKRSDRIIIQLEAELSKDEMPAVGFSHDLHTRAVDGKCAACHVEKEGVFAFKFKRTQELASMDLYHQGCIACHEEKKSAKENFGPLADECRSCHIEKQTVEKQTIDSSWKAIDFNRSLHYIHEKTKEIKGTDTADSSNCSACHHKYNEKTKEIFVAKGEEESCSYCHASETKDNIRSLRDASHDSCVKCHQTLKDKEIAAGPVSCEGCHDAVKQSQIKTVADVPRLKRNQPDQVAIMGWKKGSKETTAFMDAVAFDHKFHETATQSCKTCHHQTLKKCNDCHGTDGGGLNGGFVSLGQAMHNADSSKSCVGCHQQATKNIDCAGCHSMVASDKKQSPESCKKCHTLTPGELDGSDAQMAARGVITKRTSEYKTVLANKIPEKVEIDILSKEYKAAIFPHKKVVDAIAARVEKNLMAKVFHTDQAALCMGCHHNGPKTLEPPKCASCHSRNGSGAEGMPGLKGAYHGQCIGCHQKMEVASVIATDCVKCHEAKQ
ncbi:MAG: sulfate respiration complex hexadecaheme cytochrome HmcA [Pseudomonadota bacterium]